LPSSLAIAVEFTAFNVIAVVTGRVAGIYAAAHNIICTLTSVAFMIPLAISNAVAVKVGFTNGYKYFKSLKEYAFTGMKMSVCFMAVSAVLIGIFAKQLAQVFTPDIELMQVCIPLIYILCFFQVFDGLQVTLSGIFKGLKQTQVVMVSNIVSYWIISFPFGYLLAFHFNMMLKGFWCALAISSAVLCYSMYFYLMKKFKNLN